VNFLEQVNATLTPASREDLALGVAEHIGRRLSWQACWVIEDGRYEGQWAMMPLPPDHLGIGWVPECDLADIAPVRAGITT
jgi:hypothetical protein